MLIKVLCVFGGLAGGVLVAAGVFAFISAIGVIARLSAITGTAKYTWIYEDMVALGGAIGNIVYTFAPKLAVGVTFLTAGAILAGIFTGCVVMALAEVINIIPIAVTRVKLKIGFGVIICSFSLGKFMGSLYQLLNAD